MNEAGGPNALGDGVVQTYPSPNPDGEIDPRFYHRDSQQEQSISHSFQAQQSQEQQLSMQSDIEPRFSDYTEQSSSPTIQDNRPLEMEIRSAEDLQLAAQLGHSLSDPGNMISRPDQRINVDALATDPNLRHLMASTDSGPEGQTTHYMHSEGHAAGQLPTSLSTHLHSQLADMPLGIDHQLMQSYSLPDSPSRKRTKVSRACDECRRKKVKCDASPDSGSSPCSNCKRSNLTCLFSRVPQKRGPSKGYIKELADRIGSIEDKLVHERSLKRSQSGISGDAGAQSDTHPIPVPLESELRDGQAYQPLSLASGSATHPPERFPTTYDPTPRLPKDLLPAITVPPVSRPQIATELDAIVAANNEGTEPTSFDANDETLQQSFPVYLAVVHEYIPFLVGTEGDMAAQLLQCPTLVREAFLSSIQVASASLVLSQISSISGSLVKAYQKLLEWDSAGEQPSAIANLTYVQALVLLVIGTSNRNPALPGPSVASVLGSAVGGAFRLGLYADREPRVEDATAHAEIMSRQKVWWSIVALDRWHAVSTGTPTLISEEWAVLSGWLRPIIGQNMFAMLRLCRFLGRIPKMISLLPESPDAPTRTNEDHAKFLFHWLEDFREDILGGMSVEAHPAIHLGYWHCRQLNALLNPASLSTDLLEACSQSLNILAANNHLLTPFNHHFLALTSLCLLELSNTSESQRAVELLQVMLDSPLPQSSWDGVVSAKVGAKIRTSAVFADPVLSSAAQTASESLQRLADLAAAHTQDTEVVMTDAAEATERTEPQKTAYHDLGFDPRPILRDGYLHALNRWS